MISLLLFAMIPTYSRAFAKFLSSSGAGWIVTSRRGIDLFEFCSLSDDPGLVGVKYCVD